MALKLFKKHKLKRVIQKKTMLFVGSLCWYPNKDGIYWFLKRIYPLIIKMCPKINIWIVGRTPRRFLFPRLPNVNFFGHCHSLEYFYSKANIFIVPIRYGSGIRIKVLTDISNFSNPIIAFSKRCDPSIAKGKVTMATLNKPILLAT